MMDEVLIDTTLFQSLAESLESKARARVVDPIIEAITAILAKRFRAQAKVAPDGGQIAHATDLKTAARLDDLLERAADSGADYLKADLGLEGVEPPNLTRQGAELLADLDRTSAREVRSIIKDGTLQGLDRDEIRAQIEAAFRDWADARAGAAALQEVSTAFHDGMLAAAKDSGADLVKEWLVDSNPCPICEDNAGDVLALDEPFASGVIMAPQHLNCLPGDTVVSSSGRISSCYRRLFERELVCLRIEGNVDLAITPNHPVLSQRGWIPAGSVQVGDYLLQCVDPGAAVVLMDPHDYNVETRIEQIADTLRVAGGMESAVVPTSPVAFHGDGADQEVEVIRLNGLLSEHREPRQCFENAILRRAATLNQAQLAAESGHTQLFDGPAPSSDGTVSGGRDSGTILRSGLSHSCEHSSTSVSLKKSSFPEPSDNYGTGNADSFRHRQNAFSCLMRLVQVVHVGSRKSFGHVYNLETLDGFYFANSIVVHNCRCSVRIFAE